MAADLSRLTPALAIMIAVAALLVVDLVPTIGQAAIASFFGASSQACGLGFRFGWLPRLRFSDAEWGSLSAAKALQVTAAPLTARLALFAAGTGIWLLTRQPGAWLPTLSLAIGQGALCAFVGGAAPFAATTGRKWLTTLFGRADLWRGGGFYRAHLLALSGLWSLGCLGLIALYLSVAGHAGVFGPSVFGFQRGLAAAKPRSARPAAGHGGAQPWLQPVQAVDNPRSDRSAAADGGAVRELDSGCAGRRKAKGSRASPTCPRMLPPASRRRPSRRGS